MAICPAAGRAAKAKMPVATAAGISRSDAMVFIAASHGSNSSGGRWVARWRQWPSTSERPIRVRPEWGLTKYDKGHAQLDLGLAQCRGLVHRPRQPRFPVSRFGDRYFDSAGSSAERETASGPKPRRDSRL